MQDNIIILDIRVISISYIVWMKGFLFLISQIFKNRFLSSSNKLINNLDIFLDIYIRDDISRRETNRCVCIKNKLLCVMLLRSRVRDF